MLIPRLVVLMMFALRLSLVRSGKWLSKTSSFAVRKRHLLTATRGGGASTSDDGTIKYDVSVCAIQGGRTYMEDEFFFNTGGFCAVFDGHGGPSVSRYLRQNLYANLQALLPSAVQAAKEEGVNDESGELESATVGVISQAPPSVEDYEKALRAALEKVDREVQRISHWSFQGSTAVAVWVHEDKQTGEYPNRTILVANIGDSRAVLSRNGTAIDLTVDHKPDAEYERARIEERGGTVQWCGLVDEYGSPVLEAGVYRVNGNLALSRAVGDRSERAAGVTADPDIALISLENSEDDFIILATDGLWDVFSNQEAVSFVHEKLKEGQDLGNLKPDYNLKDLQDKMCDMIVAEALKRGTLDNVTVLIMWLRPVR